MSVLCPKCNGSGQSTHVEDGVTVAQECNGCDGVGSLRLSKSMHTRTRSERPDPPPAPPSAMHSRPAKGAGEMVTYWIVSFRDRQGVVLSHRKEEVDDMIALGGVIDGTIETDSHAVAQAAFEAWITTFIRREGVAP